jgi:hypothetical protein
MNAIDSHDEDMVRIRKRIFSNRCFQTMPDALFARLNMSGMIGHRVDLAGREEKSI